MRASASRARTADDDIGSSDATRAITALRRLVRALRATTHDGPRSPLVTAAQLFVLRQLGDAPGLSLGELARRTHTTQSTVSEVVARLVDTGLVRRRVAADDGRRRELTLTARGRAIVGRAPQSTSERLRDAFEAMSPARRRAIALGLEGWLAAAGLDATEQTLVLEPGGHGIGGPG